MEKNEAVFEILEIYHRILIRELHQVLADWGTQWFAYLDARLQARDDHDALRAQLERGMRELSDLVVEETRETRRERQADRKP